eukprot:m.329650 g.329650  ORF g.329650 m.329650 type:complete len:714 (-) comp16039_c0_seq1:128-2269(-)
MSAAMLVEYGLKIGSQIDIQRSDGRVHAAVISGCNEGSNSVTVEWFENNETKGKEIDFALIVSINKLQKAPEPAPAPALAPSDKAPSSQQQKVQIPQRLQERQQQHMQRRQQQQERKKQAQEDKRQGGQQKRQSAVAAAPASSSRPAQSAKGRRSNPPEQRKPEPAASSPAVSRQAQPVQQFSAADEAQLSKADRKILHMIEDCRAKMQICPFPVNQQVFEDKITVCVRKRPVSKKEKDKKEIDCITMPDGELTVVHEAKEKVDLTKFIDNHEFRFDYSFDDACNNKIVYNFTAAPLVKTIFERGMATCFAYGQTGSGKTFTMGGNGQKVEGIYALAAKDVFHLNRTKHKALNLVVSISFFEIYGGKVFDLLNKQKRLRVLEDGKNQVQVVGLSEKAVETIEEVETLLAIGTRARATGSTSANATSSRSHAVFQIILRNPEKRGKLHGKFSLIDLAGNERGADTASADRQTRMEGAEINKSLLALKECIRALGRKGAHTPFRASKLTLVLRDSFLNPRARTCMIAMISPGKSSCEHTLNTLRYADRVKELAPGKRRARGVAERVSAPVDDLEDEEEEEAEEAVAELESSLVRQDLQMLHQSMRSRGEMGQESDEIFHFHEAVSEVVEAEERIVEEHRAALQFDRQILAEEEALLDEVDGVNYDVEEYARRLDQILSTKIEKLQHLKTNLSRFRQQLQDEETQAKTLKGLKFVP